MSNKFGLADDPEDDGASRSSGLDLSSFGPVRKRAPLDLVEVDAAAAPHGFVSREAAPLLPPADVTPAASVAARPASVPAPVPPNTPALMPAAMNVRRRVARAEPSRSLAVRMVVPEYDRFVAYADRYQLTYHEAIRKLLDDAGE